MDWSAIIAILGFFMSLAMWVRTLHKERTKIEACVPKFDSYCMAFGTNRSLELIIPILLNNLSTNPVSVVAVRLCGETICSCKLRQSFVGVNRNNIPTLDGDPPYVRYLESAQFPINLSAMQSTFEYIRFELPKDYDALTLSKIVVLTPHKQIVISDSEQIERVRELLQKASKTASLAHVPIVR